jgi:signal transduction histidine kinase
MQLTPEVLVPRLGDTLVKRNLITETQLEQALAHQAEQKNAGHKLLLGEAIVALGFLTRTQLDTAVTEQIISLRNALEDANRNLEKRVEQRTSELQLALAKLAELNQIKTNFISNVSHELRTPLTHIKGYVELLVTESLGPLTEDQKGALEVSQRSVNRLKNLIDDLIMFSAAARGEMALQRQALNLYSIASAALNYAQPKADDHNVELLDDVDASLPSMLADEQKLSWVINQLLDNAIKFTSSGGTVKLSMRREPDNANMARISVSDTGIGIPEHRFTEIFEAFHQLDGSSTRRYGGTGLGLALVKEIVEAHGSVIQIKSKVNEGTEFSFLMLLQ